MPELPEVETVIQGLKPAIEGQFLNNVIINRYDLRGGIPDSFIQDTHGSRITHIERRAKYIIINLSRDIVIILHLGMSGSVRIYKDKNEYVPRKHDHALFDCESGTRIAFEDPRRFGMLYTAPAERWQAQAPFNTMGPEPLSNAFDSSYLRTALKKRTSPIKSALLDQKLVVGLGNIYVCEALHRAHINPLRSAQSLNQSECDVLVPIIKEVLNEAISAGGSTLRDHKQTDGSLGYFQHSFRVYGQEHASCSQEKCSGTIIRCVQAGRSTFYCPQCQL